MGHPQKRDEIERLRQRNNILEAVAMGAEQLMKSGDLEPSLAHLLANLGQAVDADRAYLFENRTDTLGAPFTCRLHHWINPAAADPELPDLWDYLMLDVGLGRWAKILEADKPVHGLAEAFLPAEREILAAQQILSIVILPISVRGSWWGWMGFDSRRVAREWSAAEIAPLKAAAGIIGAAIENKNLQQEIEGRAGHLAALHDVSRTIGSTLDQDKVLKLTLERVCALFAAPKAAVYLVDFIEDVALLHEARGFGPQEIERTTSVSLKSGFIGQVIITGRPVFFEKGAPLPEETPIEAQDGSASDTVEFELAEGASVESVSPAKAKATALIPLAVGEHVLGTLNLVFDEPRSFSEDDRRLLIAIGRQVGIALANARLYQEILSAEQETRRRADHLAALHEIDQAINSSLDPTAVYASVVKQAAALLGCQAANLFLWEGGQAVVAASFGSDTSTTPGLELSDRRITPAESEMVARLEQSREPIAVADAQDVEFALPDLRNQQASAFLTIPLLSRDQITGHLLLIDQIGPRQWRRDEIKVASQLASQAAIAIENARLFEAEQKSHRTAEALRETAHIVNTSPDLDRALDLLLEQLAQLVPYDSATVFLQDGQHLRAAASRGFPDPQRVMQLVIDPSSNALIRQTVETGQPLVLPDAQADDRFKSWAGTDYARGWIGVPLLVGEDLVGIMTIDNCQPDAYDEKSARLAQALADHTAVAIHKSRLLNDLRRANQELRRLDELKGQFIQNVAHELRTPVTLVRGYVELLAQGNLDLQAQHEALHTALSHTETLVHLVEGITTLQDLSLGELALQRINTSDLIKTALQLASQKAVRAGINLQSQCPSLMPQLKGDFIWLAQALYQLLDNAIKFSPDGGRVTLRLQADEENREIEIAVEDQGIGVPPSEQDRIFDLFYQADGSTTRRFGGTGLGLAIVQRVVTAHGGRVWVVSPTDQKESGQYSGSRFIMRLPQPGM
jgi:GAF domain-containing protein